MMSISVYVYNTIDYACRIHRCIPVINNANISIHKLTDLWSTLKSTVCFCLSTLRSCWLRNDIVFYVAVVAYFCVIFLFNSIMFVVVMVQLSRILRQNPHSGQHRSTLQDARRVAGVTVLLGLTWGFAFFSWGPVNLAFMYLFTIFNTLQGG